MEIKFWAPHSDRVHEDNLTHTGTDDTGVFGCSLAGEYLKVWDAFGPVDLVRVVDDGAAAAFDACCGEAVRRRRGMYNV